MGYAAETIALSAEQFLAWVAGQLLRHEFVRGAIFAMAGGLPDHGLITLNISGALWNGLKDGPKSRNPSTRARMGSSLPASQRETTK